MSTTKTNPNEGGEPTFRIDRDAFVEWCEQQIEQSRSRTARIICNTDEQVKFRIREEGDYTEDIVLLNAGDADILRFVREEGKHGDKTIERRQFPVHKYKFTFHDKTLIVRFRGRHDGEEICRAGTGTMNQKGPFPV